jgi:hypothetical protein
VNHYAATSDRVRSVKNISIPADYSSVTRVWLTITMSVHNQRLPVKPSILARDSPMLIFSSGGRFCQPGTTSLHKIDKERSSSIPF